MNPIAAADPSFRRVPASRGLAWWGLGWRGFLRAPWAWLGMSLALIFASVVLAQISHVLAQWLTMPLFALGAMFASELDRRWNRARSITPEGLAVEADNEGALGDSSRRWAGRIGPLLLASLIVLLLLAALTLLLALLVGTLLGIGLMRLGSFAALLQASPSAAMAGLAAGAGMVWFVGVLILVSLFLASVVFWFVGTLVSLGGMRAWPAVRLSARAALGNLGALFVFSLLLVPVAILATIPLGLGWLLLPPVLSAASYASYDDVFGGEAPTGPSAGTPSRPPAGLPRG